MVELTQAVSLAKQFLKEELGADQLAGGLENRDFWFFSSGTPGVLNVGGLVLSVSKETGKVEVVPPGHESMVMLRQAAPVELPQA